MRSCIPAVSVLLAMALGGCGGSGGLSQGLATTLADYQVIDLESGAVEAKATIPDLLTNPALRDRYLVVRRLSQRTAAIGQNPLTFAVQADEVPDSSSLPPCYLAVFELTRAQWYRIAMTTPWTTVQDAALIGSGGDTLPACGISQVQAVAALASMRSRGLDLHLPDDATWESAARAGSALFPWGDDKDHATLVASAVIAETTTGIGPQAVGGRAAGASGCYDMVGNVAEWTSAGNLRGGSWNDPLSLARPANIRDLPTDIPLATAGVRVVYRPASR